MASWLPEEYLMPTGYTGMAIFWGGLAAQVGVLVTLGVLADATSQPIGVVLAAYFLSMGIYFAIDLAYVFLFEMRVLNEFLFGEAKGDANKNGEVFVTPGMKRPALLPVFFLYAAAANAFAIVLPALDDDTDLLAVAFRAFLLGWFAYGNLALVQAWSYRYFPLELVGPLPLSGGALSCAASTLTVLICRAIFEIS
jgi:hypothetical protein